MALLLQAASHSDRTLTTLYLVSACCQIAFDQSATLGQNTAITCNLSYGTSGVVGAGFHAILDDNGAGPAVYLVASDGTAWWYQALTKALYHVGPIQLVDLGTWARGTTTHRTARSRRQVPDRCLDRSLGMVATHKPRHGAMVDSGVDKLDFPSLNGRAAGPCSAL